MRYARTRSLQCKLLLQTFRWPQTPSENLWHKGRLKNGFSKTATGCNLIETTLSDGLPFSEGNGDVVPVRPEFFFEHGRQFPVEIPRAVGHLQCAAGTMEGKPPAV